MNFVAQELPEIQKRYNDQWKHIKTKYPRADGKIHFAFNGEFVPVNDSLSSLLKRNHFIFLNSEAKSKAQSILKSNKDASDEDIKKILLSAPLNPDCRIEVIWGDLDYDLIAELQVEPLIDQDLTPKTRASIRIVLGVIGYKK